ncbi:hypothetical protein H4R18_004093 [Coemansia javaensis]|uniref:Uncharacterized protein n=1 Tax=Coemansia javaensis TaxID=2761396 RepID=A0A9W8LGA6_9FUNG|nr:hypothetical protein H4R18_004093 [Coemansia javaensis]
MYSATPERVYYYELRGEDKKCEWVHEFRAPLTVQGVKDMTHVMVGAKYDRNTLLLLPPGKIPPRSQISDYVRATDAMLASPNFAHGRAGDNRNMESQQMWIYHLDLSTRRD